MAKLSDRSGLRLCSNILKAGFLILALICSSVCLSARPFNTLYNMGKEHFEKGTQNMIMNNCPFL